MPYRYNGSKSKLKTNALSSISWTVDAQNTDECPISLVAHRGLFWCSAGKVRSHVARGKLTEDRHWRQTSSTVVTLAVRYASVIPVQPLHRLVVGVTHQGRFSRDPLSAFSVGGPCEQFWHGQGCPLFNVVHPAFPLPTTASPISSQVP